MSSKINLFHPDHKDILNEKRLELNELMNNLSIYPPMDNIQTNEFNIYIDSNYLEYISNYNSFKLPLLKSTRIISIYCREFIMEMNSQIENLLNSNKFFILRITSPTNSSEKLFSDNTSVIDQTTDIILNKSQFINPFYSLESKYFLKFDHTISTSFFEFQILDDKANPIHMTDLNNFFIDLKISYLSYIM